ncbi:hypothetical protein [Butyrivibrio sp. LB2008]|nr:hypothetical protein [Butyrivibrio sp. LB2008]
MRELNSAELVSVNGGDETIYDKAKRFVLEQAPDFIEGFKDGWNGK